MKSRVTALLLAGALGISLMTGCGGINKSAVAASLGEQKVTLGFANFYTQFQRANTEDMYRMYFGQDVWTQDFSGTGTTMMDSLKESTMDSLHDMYTLQAHMLEYNVELTEDDKAAIAEAVKKFMSGNSSDAISQMGASEGYVEELLTLYTIQERMRDEIKSGADTNVSDDEANMRGYTQVVIRTDSHTNDEGQSVDYTDEEKAGLKTLAEQMVQELSAAGATLESVAEAHDYTTSTSSYSTYESKEDEDDEEDNEDEVVAALKKLKKGETSGVIEKNNAYYIVRVDNDTDKDATEKKRKSLVESRQSEYYDTVLEGWQEDDGWTVNEGNLKKIVFENIFTTTVSTEETP